MTTKQKLAKTGWILATWFGVALVLEAIKLNGAAELTVVDILALFAVADTWFRRDKKDETHAE